MKMIDMTYYRMDSLMKANENDVYYHIDSLKKAMKKKDKTRSAVIVGEQDMIRKRYCQLSL
jgi:hypothetical protein